MPHLSKRKRQRMYEHVPVQRMVDDLRYIYHLYRTDDSFTEADVESHAARMVFLRGLLNNLKHGTSKLSPRLLAGIPRHMPLSIGGAFRLQGYRLDSMRQADFHLNGHRTRIVESYPFHRDREVDLPLKISSDNILGRTMFVSDIVLDWQTGIPIRRARGTDWQPQRLLYIQIGAEDTLRLSGLPPGAVVSIEPVSQSEQANPDSDALYFLQYGNGYLCSRCTVLRGKLSLLPVSGSYDGIYEYFYPQEVRVVGRVRGFASSLPPKLEDSQEHFPSRHMAPLVLPWEQQSFRDLLRAEGVRYGRKESALEKANDILLAASGTTLSARTLRRYEHKGDITPHTNTMVALSLFHGIRISDALRSLRLWPDEAQHHSLTAWLRANALKDLPKSVPAAESPHPRSQWDHLIRDWGEWPTLLSMAIPQMERLKHRLIRVNQAKPYENLDPVIRQGAIALLEETDRIPDTKQDRQKQGWNRPIYAVRHGGEILCGYLDNDGQHVALIPHPRSTGRRISFLHRQITMIGRVIGLASPMPHDHREAR
jgi:hypothetical protein